MKFGLILFYVILLLITRSVKDGVSRICLLVYNTYWMLSVFFNVLNPFQYYEASWGSIYLILIHLLGFNIAFYAQKHNGRLIRLASRHLT